VTQALGRIKEVQIKVGGVQCNMTFMVVDTDSYDVLLGLNLLIKIGAIVDVEQGLIQVRRGPGTDVEVLPLTMVNLVQRSDSENSIHSKDGAVKCVSTGSRIDEESLYWNALGANPQMVTQEFESEADSGDDTNEGSQPEVPVEDESEFEDTTLDNLIRSEGPQQILQLTLQSQMNNFMKEEITDVDDYVDWIRWAADGENRMKNPSESANATGGSVVLQVLQEENTASSGSNRKRITDDRKGNERWEDISQKLRIDQGLDELKRSVLWRLLDQYQDVFAWNKGELGCCTVGEHSIDTQGFPPCRVAPGRLSFWEETEVKRQIDTLVEMRKMRPSDSEYACRVTLPVKKDGSMKFYGDYRPLNLQTRRDSFPMPLVEDIISVTTPLWPSVGVKPNTWKSWRLGVFRDSRMFRARQQGAKHLALGCSWCHWKGLET
jgi:hypothetical protein